MKVIVDTCVWWLALRRKNVDENESFVIELKGLVKEVRVQLLGPIRQEILSGIPEIVQFKKLRETLSAFPDLEIGSDVFEEAARYFNMNRAKGIHGSNTDFLICAASKIYGMPILTFDKDFQQFQNNTAFELHYPRQ